MHHHCTLAVADSFRVRETSDGAQVRGWALHLARFQRTVTETLADAAAPTDLHPTEIDAFLSDATARISQFGAGFPRLELWHQPVPALPHTPSAPRWRLHLSLRELPQLRSELRAALAAGITVQHPTRKGPNIETFTRLNHSLGVEALLLNRAGCVSEGTTTSILWWEDGTLCRSDATDRVPSVTESLVTNIASATGYPVAVCTLTPAKLRSYPAWGVNALHGIRPIVKLDGTPLVPQHRSAPLRAFQAALDETWQSVS